MSRWSEYKEKNGVTPLDMLNPNSKPASAELAEQRMDMCIACPEFIKVTKQCKKCGCVMTAKTRLQAAKCPIGKW
jgi:hypothetical protein